jgi:divalent metal cation (Fe/Co/Zn/Cd) transporter
MWLSIVLFSGSALYWFMPSLWFVDAVAAIVLAGFIAREGLETIREANDPDGGCCAHDHG